MKMSCLPQIGYHSAVSGISAHYGNFFNTTAPRSEKAETIIMKLVPIHSPPNTHTHVRVCMGKGVQNKVLGFGSTVYPLHNALRSVKVLFQFSLLFTSIHPPSLPLSSLPSLILHLLYCTRPTLDAGDVAKHYELHLSLYSS